MKKWFLAKEEFRCALCESVVSFVAKEVTTYTKFARRAQRCPNYILETKAPFHYVA